MTDTVPPLTPPPIVARIAEATGQAGGRCLLVGGSVRDHLMGLPIKDWDLEVYGLAPDILEQTLASVARVDTVGRAFSVFKIHRRGLEVDVSIPRRDSKVGPGHKGIEATGDPTMTPAEAARRRDLTINAIMVDLHDGSVLDPADGRADLRRGILAPVDPATFLEDPLRTLRVVQFAARLGFTPTPVLVDLARAAHLDELPEERIVGEWAKLLVQGAIPSHGLAFARDAALLDRVFPEHPHPPAVDTALDRAVSLRAGDDVGRDMALMTTVWLAGLEGRAAVATLDRLKLHRWHGVPVRELALTAVAHLRDPIDTDADLRWLATRAEVDLTLRAREAVTGHPTADARARAAALGVLHEASRPWVQGRDLKRLGVPPGPGMGALLERVYAAQLDGTVATRDEALAWAGEAAGA